jgi:ribosomal protein S18 acetylase RimI-like enzyme
VELRPARPEDAAGLACVHVAAWSATYRGVMTDAFLDAMDVERWAVGWRRQLTTPEAGVWSHVAVDGDDVVRGFVVVGPARDGSDDGELYAINVHPDCFGRGEGAALFAAGCAELGRRGHHQPYLMVVEQNARARHFYERHGWSWDGERVEAEVGGTAITELRYRPQARPRGGNDPLRA